MMIWISSRGSPSSDPDYSTVESQVNQLEVKRLLAQENSEDTSEIDRQIANFKVRLEELRPSHDAEVRRQAQEAEREKMKQYEKEQAEFQKRCEATRSKRVVELTVNDLQLLKQCGTDVQGVIPHVR
jgi:predicted SprT family Zn-dependent metalloprotease